MNALSDLSLRDVYAVLALARLRHFGAAAAACHVTQPTISAQIRKVERLLGERMFERGPRLFLVTPFGERMLPLLQSLADQVALLSETADARTNKPLCGVFRLGVITTLGPFYIPRFLPRLLKAFPDLELSLSEQLTEELFKSLRLGELDAALISGPMPTPGMESLPLFREPFVLMAPVAHPIAAMHPLQRQHLKAPEMVLLAEGHCLRDQALDLCNKRYGQRPYVVATSIETLRYLVAMGNGYTLLPRLALRDDPSLESLVTYREFDQGGPSRLIELVYRAGSPHENSAHALAALLRKWRPKETQPVDN